MKKKLLVLTILVTLSASMALADDDLNGSELRGLAPIQLFMQTCVTGRGRTELVADIAPQAGFEVADGYITGRYLGGNAGHAWHLDGEDGEFGLTVLGNGLCSVFIHQENPETLRKSMESWLPPEGSGFSYKKELVSQSEFLETTAYKIFEGDRLVEQWVITTTSKPNSSLAAIMSYQST